MQYTGIVITKCPYCSHLNRSCASDLQNQRAEVIECNSDGKGCGQAYAIRPTLQVVTEVFSMEQVTK